MSENILIVHNYYQIPGGEDTVVENEKNLLEEHGHKVVLYTRHNNEINEMGLLRKAGLFVTTIYNRKTYKDICEIIKRESIDIVHVHNTLNLISPAVFYAAKKTGVPVVNTIHNFRMICPKATLYRDGKVCEDCLNKGMKCAVARRCYRDSFSQTLTCVIAARIHRIKGIYKYVYYICLTKFNKDKLLEINNNKSGKYIIPDKVFVKPNFMKASGREIVKAKDREAYVLYAGRLDESKGIDILLRACDKTKIKVVIAGSGAMKEEVEKRCEAGSDGKVEYLGLLKHEEVVRYMKKAKAVVLPTRWYEGFPMSIAESFSVGTPVIGSNIGNVGNIIRDCVTGYLFENGNSDELAVAINKFASLGDNEEVLGMYENALKEFENKYTDEINYDELIEIYRKIMDQQL